MHLRINTGNSIGASRDRSFLKPPERHEDKDLGVGGCRAKALDRPCYQRRRQAVVVRPFIQKNVIRRWREQPIYQPGYVVGIVAVGQGKRRCGTADTA